MATKPLMMGRLFGRLTVVEFAGTDRHQKRKWQCACACGKSTTVGGGELRAGKTLSCGCLGTERRVAAVKISNAKHGRAGSPEHLAWISMRRRCDYQKNKSWKSYGERGISVCERWINSFENFYADMGDRPSPMHSLDRKETDGNYTPENCKWSTKLEQTRNRRCTRRLTLNGETKTLTEWGKLASLSANCIVSRLQRGWTTQKALSTPAGIR